MNKQFHTRAENERLAEKLIELETELVRRDVIVERRIAENVRPSDRSGLDGMIADRDWFIKSELLYELRLEFSSVEVLQEGE